MTIQQRNTWRWMLCLTVGAVGCDGADLEPEVAHDRIVASALTLRDVPWRTANWNICQTALDDPGTRQECRAKIDPTDTSRTASAVERRAIGDLLLEPDRYSVSLQEVCERDVRWIAAYVANDGNVGSDGTFAPRQYAAIDTLAPYAFLPYLTAEIIGSGADHGCGPGVSTGIAVIVKSEAGAPAPAIRGLSNADYVQRLSVPFTYAQLQSSACDFYFDAQVNRRSPEWQTSFRADGCRPSVALDTLRGLACVQTSWRASPRATSLTRATSCSTHIINRGEPYLNDAADRQLAAASHEAILFANHGPLMLGGDFNYVGQQEAFEGLTPALRKVSQGPTHRLRCTREIDGIYVRGWSFAVPMATRCEVIDIAHIDDLHFGDFDGDGTTDVFHRQPDGRWRFSSGGDGPWQALNRSAVPSAELAFGDFDGDGVTDVFHRHDSGQWRYSSGGVGRWVDLEQSGAPRDELDFGDFDGDGKTDVFHRAIDGQWRFSSGGVTPWRNLNRSAAPGHELAFGDFDGDGVTDVFHRHDNGQWRYSSGGVDRWRNLDGSGAPREELRFGDFDGDGVTDVFHREADGRWRYSANGVSTWADLNVSGVLYELLRFGDFDGDGKTDVFTPGDFGVWRYSSGARSRWRFLGSAIEPLDPNDPFSWSDHALNLSPPLTRAPRTKTDFDGDGISDVFHRRSNGRWRYSSGGVAGWQDLERSAAAITELDVGDFDGDRIADVFHRDSTGQWWFSSAGITRWQSLNRSSAPGHELRFGDFDGDGITDVFHRHASGQWRFSSGGVLRWQNLNQSAVPGVELGFGDFDGDGKTDVFHRHSSGQWRFSSGGVEPWHNLERSAAPGHELRFGDFDGDGVTDVFHRHATGQWRYSKSGAAPWRNLNRSGEAGEELRLGDFDGDGVTDVFHRASSGQWRYSRRGVQDWEDLNGSWAPLGELLFEL